MTIDDRRDATTEVMCSLPDDAVARHWSLQHLDDHFVVSHEPSGGRWVWGLPVLVKVIPEASPSAAMSSYERLAKPNEVLCVEGVLDDQGIWAQRRGWSRSDVKTYVAAFARQIVVVMAVGRFSGP